jgi:hypothetical protein
MPAGYGLAPEGAGRFIAWEEISDQLRRARNYWLCTASPRGRPHAAPVWGLWEDDRFIFSTDARSRKAADLKNNPHVVVHLESGDEVVMVEGRARPLVDRKQLSSLGRMYRKKYGFPLDSGQTVQVVPTRILAWSEADFPSSATRWERVEPGGAEAAGS